MTTVTMFPWFQTWLVLFNNVVLAAAAAADAAATVAGVAATAVYGVPGDPGVADPSVAHFEVSLSISAAHV